MSPAKGESSRLRVFAAPDTLRDGRLHWEGQPARRLYLAGARAGDMILFLDGAGWEFDVLLERADLEVAEGPVGARRLATERRTKASLYPALEHPRRMVTLVAAATAIGAVAVHPTITGGSVVPDASDGSAEDWTAAWRAAALSAAEASGRGRMPRVEGPFLLDHALDLAARSGSAIFFLDPDGPPPAEALEQRPFALALFCPPPGGFDEEERARAAARGGRPMLAPWTGPDSLRMTLAALDALYATLEPPSRE